VLGLAAIVVASTGCWTERIVWSPDGQVAIVATAGSWYRLEPDGALQRLDVPEGAYRFAWLGGSERLVLARRRHARTLRELQAALPPDRMAALSAKADAIWHELASGTHPDNLTTDFDIFAPEGDAIGLILMSRHGEWMHERFPEAGDEDPSVAIDGLILATLRGARLEPGETIVEDLYMIGEIRPSPREPAIAFVTRRESLFGPIGPAAIRVFRSDVRQTVLVTDHASESVDWLPDGRTIVYLDGADSDWRYQLGGLVTRQVVPDSGGRLDDTIRWLATVLFARDARVRALPDTRVLFTAAPHNLPSTSPTSAEEIYLLDPSSREGTLTPVIPLSARGSLPEWLPSFEVSPDGARLLVPGTNGDVMVVDLAERRAEMFREDLPNDGRHHVPLPAWRQAGEFSRLRRGAPGIEFVLQRGRSQVVLSGRWPGDVIAGLVR
jgi:hypothetical protein